MSAPASTRARYLALIAALLGWMFDGMEMGLFPLVGRSAVGELLHVEDQLREAKEVSGGTDSEQYKKMAKSIENSAANWYGIVMAAFLIGAATGGVVFGWLGDKIGRVRAMTLSVLLYSLCSGLSAASASPWQLAALRFLGALGMGGEWTLGVALVMEVWQGASRGWLAGWIGAFGNLGYVICGGIAFGLNRVGKELPGTLTSIGLPENWALTLTANGNWRLLMLLGAVPALLTLFIRLFVPESERWKKESEAGHASFWSNRDLIGVLVGALAAGGVVSLWAIPDLPIVVQALGSVAGLVVVLLGYLYPVRGYLSRSRLPEFVQREQLRRMLLAAGLSGVPLLGTWAGLMWVYQWVNTLPSGKGDADARPIIQMVTALTAAVGCLIGAVLAGRFGRRIVYAILCVGSMASLVGFYSLNKDYNVEFVASAGVLAMISAAFYGWLPLYLPELFRTSVRATGQGFGFNFGRIIAAAGNLQMANLLAQFDNRYDYACSVVAAVYVVGLVLIAIAPETRGKPLPE